VVGGRRDDAGVALIAHLWSLGADAEFVRADVCKDTDVRAMVDKVVNRFGRLDVAVNNAGAESIIAPITHQTAENYTTTFDANVLGVLLSVKHEARVMQEQGRGSIINITSPYGHEGAPGAAVYVGSKRAVEVITKMVALELAKFGVRVNGVTPGPADTDVLNRLTKTSENDEGALAEDPTARLGRSKELADAMVFMASDDTPYATGEILHMDRSCDD
jgi:NAD(P)-dependent dehydrogenase (short-subunit alcohol dehydrogenase family)